MTVFVTQGAIFAELPIPTPVPGTHDFEEWTDTPHTTDSVVHRKIPIPSEYKYRVGTPTRSWKLIDSMKVKFLSGAAYGDTGKAAEMAGFLRKNPSDPDSFQMRLQMNVVEAAEMGVISKSPCWKIKPKRDLPRIEQFEMRFLDETEIRALADAIDPFFRPLILTAGYTGMRFGELAGLRVKHLKLLERSISVEEGMTDVRGKQSFGPLKTKASRRTVSIPQFLVDVLAAHLAQRGEVKAEDLVFVSEKGGPLRASNIRRRSWEKAVEATVGSRCRFHDLRHSHAALLIKAGVHPKVIQKRMGHSSIRTTLDTYGHVYDELDQQVAETLETTFRASIADRRGQIAQL